MADENQIHQSPAVPPQAKEEAKRGGTHAGNAAEDLRSAASATTGEHLGRAEGLWNDARRSFQEDSEQYVRDNPTKAVFTALAFGFLLGFAFPR